MGNRAVITDTDRRIGVYLHWNGGPNSVRAFLRYCKLRGFRADDYGWARLCQVIGNFFGGGLSVGIDTLDHLDCDNGDNGMYVMDGWELVGHEYDGPHQDGYDVDEMVLEIDSRQPVSERLGRYLTAVETPTSQVKIGDVVWFEHHDGERVPYEITGFCEDWVMGRGRVTVPYSSAHGDDNPNYRVLGETCMVCPADQRDDMLRASAEYLRCHDAWLHKPLLFERKTFGEVMHELGL